MNNTEKIQRLCSFIPYFERIDPDKICQWKGGKTKSGTLTWPYPVYDRKLMDFIEAFYESGLMVKNYSEELEQRVPNWQKDALYEVIETADIELFKNILTKAVRSERFCDGAWANYTKSGLFLAMLRRLNSLIINGEIPIDIIDNSSAPQGKLPQCDSKR